MRDVDLAPGQQPAHVLHIAADGPEALAANADEVQNLRQLIAETGELSVRATIAAMISVDAERSPSPGRVNTTNPATIALLKLRSLTRTSAKHRWISSAHEFTYLWNGKYRRPADWWLRIIRRP